MGCPSRGLLLGPLLFCISPGMGIEKLPADIGIGGLGIVIGRWARGSTCMIALMSTTTISRNKIVLTSGVGMMMPLLALCFALTPTSTFALTSALFFVPTGPLAGIGSGSSSSSSPSNRSSSLESEPLVKSFGLRVSLSPSNWRDDKHDR